jgi:hypothetical protein
VSEIPAQHRPTASDSAEYMPSYWRADGMVAALIAEMRPEHDKVRRWLMG